MMKLSIEQRVMLSEDYCLDTLMYFDIGNKYIVTTPILLDVDAIVNNICQQLINNERYSSIQLLSVRIDNRFYSYNVELNIQKPIKCERITSIL